MNFAEKVAQTAITADQIAIFYLGQVGFLIKTADSTIAIDPYLTDYVDQNCSNETVCWKRLYDAPCRPEEMPKLDYVFCTHDHYDHSDPWTLREIAQTQPQVRFVAPAGLQSLFRSYDIAQERFIGAVQDQPLNIGEITVTPLCAAHEDIHLDENGVAREMGYLLDIRGTKLYHAGDTVLYDGLAQKVKGAAIAFLPINGRDYFRTRDDIIGNTDSAESLRLAKEAGISMLVPTHYDLYDVNRVSAAEFLMARERLSPYQPFHIFTPGERYIYQG